MQKMGRLSELYSSTTHWIASLLWGLIVSFVHIKRIPQYSKIGYAIES